MHLLDKVVVQIEFCFPLRFSFAHFVEFFCCLLTTSSIAALSVHISICNVPPAHSLSLSPCVPLNFFHFHLHWRLCLGWLLLIVWTVYTHMLIYQEMCRQEEVEIITLARTPKCKLTKLQQFFLKSAHTSQKHKNAKPNTVERAFNERQRLYPRTR